MNNQKSDELVYFYCSLNSFKEIIHNRSLFLSDLHYMNDSKEESLFLSAFEEAVKKEIESLPENQRKELEKNSWYLDNIPEIFTNAAFICCFSKKPDDLSQWRGYGDDAKGLCIGFDKEALEEMEIRKEKGRFYAKDVIYSTKEKIVKEISPKLKEKIQEAFKAFAPKLYRPMPATEDEIRKLVYNFEDDPFIDISKGLCEISIDKGFYKNSSFECEAEFRMCFYDKLSFEAIKKNLSEGLVENMKKTYKAAIQNEMVADLSEVKYRTANDMLIPYREMKFCESFFFKIVKSITVGSKSKININELKRFLAYEGLRVENVTLSTSTYR